MKTTIKRRVGVTFFSALAVTLFGGPVSAALVGPSGGLTLDTDPTAFYQQTTASPCVIGGSNCQNGTFPMTLAGTGGGGSTFDSTSPLYTLTQITGVTGSTGFIMGLDYNQSNDAQTLYEFGALYFSDVGGTVANGSQVFTTDTVLQTNNNGVGWSDFLLTGFNIPGNTLSMKFYASWFNNDGADRYFLIGAEAEPCTENCNPEVPEPMSLALLGIGTLGLALTRRRKQQA